MLTNKKGSSIAQTNYAEEKGHGDSSSHGASKPTKIM